MTKQMLDGFSKLPRKERFEKLVSLGALTREEADFLQKGGLANADLAEHFIENAIGYFQLPLGVATQFRIDGREMVIPMAVEETSIIAAASKTAKFVRQYGHIETSTVGDVVIGQIQIARPRNAQSLRATFERLRTEWIALSNETVAKSLCARGGGVKGMELRFVPRGDSHGDMAVIHVHLDARDAMGANIVNQVCEALKAPIELATGDRVTMCILSNLVDTKLTRARVVLTGLDADLARGIEEAALFARQDPYRAATNNKGVLNGIDPIVIATGNDWRAVEAGVHAYAARDGQYRSLTDWRYDGRELVGTFEAPIVLGIVGGVTKLHPTAQLALNMLKVGSASELARVCAAVGLVQNLGALKALTTVGIIEGHMRLHIKNLSLGAGASEQEIPLVQQRLEKVLAKTRRVSLQNAIEALREVRALASHL